MQPAMSFGLSIERIRKVARGLAVLVLIFSMFGNAFPTLTPDCCRDDKMCPVHHKHSTPAKAEKNSHMDCEHEGRGLQPCAMSCGLSHDQGVQTTAVFLLGDGCAAATLISIEQSSVSDIAVSSDLTIRPQTPPPRFSASL
jgi:hypothetical protein